MRAGRSLLNLTSRAVLVESIANPSNISKTLIPGKLLNLPLVFYPFMCTIVPTRKFLLRAYRFLTVELTK